MEKCKGVLHQKMWIWGNYSAASKCTHALLKHAPAKGRREHCCVRTPLNVAASRHGLRCFVVVPQVPLRTSFNLFSRESHLHGLDANSTLSVACTIWFGNQGNRRGGGVWSGCVGWNTKSISHSVPASHCRHVNHWLTGSHVWLVPNLLSVITLKTGDILYTVW